MITDATCLEEKENPILLEVENMIKKFQQLGSVENLFDSAPSMYNVFSIDFESIYNLFASFTFSKHTCRDAHLVGNWESTLINPYQRTHA
jgi:hypothetical protein